MYAIQATYSLQKHCTGHPALPGGLFSCLHFFYDANNKPAMVEYNGVKYAYVHNLQGDIVAILDSNGTAVVQYKYDAWGKPISKTGSMAGTLGTVQPFRYRGYVYDEETGLYYLRSRYYSDTMGRFLNCDAYFSEVFAFFRLNPFVYCVNNSITFVDLDGYEHLKASMEAESGYTALWYIVIGALQAINCSNAADFLMYSLQKEPQKRVFSMNDSISDAIVASPTFQKKVTTMIKDKNFAKEQSFLFPKSELDLFGALHRVSVVVNECSHGHEGTYDITVTDTYDYAIEKLFQAGDSLPTAIFRVLVMSLNNLAYASQAYGIINEYDIEINLCIPAE